MKKVVKKQVLIRIDESTATKLRSMMSWTDSYSSILERLMKKGE